MDLPSLKKFTNPIIGEAGIVDFSNAVDNTTEGSGVHGHVIRGTYVRSILTVSSAFDFWIPRLIFLTTYN